MSDHLYKEPPIAERTDEELPKVYATIEGVIADCKTMLFCFPEARDQRKKDIVALMSQGYIALAEVLVEMTKRGMPIGEIMQNTLRRC